MSNATWLRLHAESAYVCCQDEADRLWQIADEFERLQGFHVAVMESMHENAGNLHNPFAYIWQKEWDEIKEKAMPRFADEFERQQREIERLREQLESEAHGHKTMSEEVKQLLRGMREQLNLYGKSRENARVLREAIETIERLQAALAWMVENCPLPLTPSRDLYQGSRYAAIEKMVAEKAKEK